MIPSIAPQISNVDFLLYCAVNILHDKAFLDLTDKSTRDQNRIWLTDGEPVIFGEDDEYGVQVDANGARIVEVAEVGRHNIHVHDATLPNPSAAFALSRISQGPYGPTPLGVFRDVDSPDYGQMMERQIAAAQETRGPGDLAQLVRSRGTWTVDA